MSTGAWIAIAAGLLIVGVVGYGIVSAPRTAVSVPSLQTGAAAQGNSDVSSIAGAISALANATSTGFAAFGGQGSQGATGYGNGASFSGSGATRPTGY